MSEAIANADRRRCRLGRVGSESSPAPTSPTAPVAALANATTPSLLEGTHFESVVSV